MEIAESPSGLLGETAPGWPAPPPLMIRFLREMLHSAAMLPPEDIKPTDLNGTFLLAALC
jgi:hypothetical protein